jgi:hypothetical protein
MLVANCHNVSITRLQTGTGVLNFVVRNFTKRTVDRTIMPHETDIYRDIINWTTQDWYRNVRMSKQTFNHIPEFINS